MLYFTGAEENMEPVDIFYAVVQWTLKAIGHLFDASIYTYGPAPNFLSTWIFNYVACGIEVVFNDLPPHLRYRISRLPICSVQ